MRNSWACVLPNNRAWEQQEWNKANKQKKVKSEACVWKEVKRASKNKSQRPKYSLGLLSPPESLCPEAVDELPNYHTPMAIICPLPAGVTATSKLGLEFNLTALNFTNNPSFFPERRIQVPFSTAKEHVELMHECFPQHLRMRTNEWNEIQRQKKKTSEKSNHGMK